MDYTHNPAVNDFIARLSHSVQRGALDRRMGCNFFIGYCTNNNDPEKLNRIIVRLQFQNQEGKADMETDWLQQLTLFAGPTDPQRGIEAWGLDVPLPEV